MTSCGTSVFLAAMLILIAIIASSCQGKTAYEKTFDDLNEFDKRYNTGLDDYNYGFEHLLWNPRFPDEVNPSEIDGLNEELSALKEKAEGDEAPALLLDARINLFLAEKFFKLGRRTGKGDVYDGFSCKHGDFIINASGNMNQSVIYGRNGADALSQLLDRYPSEAAIADISPYQIKVINESFAEIADRAEKNEGTWIAFCLEKNLTVKSQTNFITDMENARDVFEKSKGNATEEDEFVRTNATNASAVE